MIDPHLFRLAQQAAEVLIARKETLGISESSAGGLVSSALLAVPGASAYFLGGSITYARPAARGFLGVERLPEGMRSATEPYAAYMAGRVRDKLGATWALAEAGAAGPTGNRYGDPAGHTCLAVAGPIARVKTLRTGAADRAANMQSFAEAALTLLVETLHAAGKA